VGDSADRPAPKNIWRLATDHPHTRPAAVPWLGGQAPYVINLTASSAPMRIPSNGVLNCEHLHVYQVKHMDGGRPRFRLRLGLIRSELEADGILAAVRNYYPAALTATAGEDDLTAIAAAIAAKLGHEQASELIEQEPKHVGAGPIHKVHHEQASKAGATLVDLTLQLPTLSEGSSGQSAGSDPVKRALDERPASIATRPPTAFSSPPVTAGLTDQSGAATVVFAATPPVNTDPQLPAVNSRARVGPLPASVARDAHQVTIESPPAVINAGSEGATASPAATGKVVGRQFQILAESGAAIDSTHSSRVLTRLELAEDLLPKWFIIQLALAADHFRPEDIPNLDIFREFHLYTVVGRHRGRTAHALRLGFFTEEVAAQAVAGYLLCHFEASTVLRVGPAERERFSERRIAPRKGNGATGLHAVIELSTPPPVPETRLADLSQSANRRSGDNRTLRSPPLVSAKR